MMWLKCYKIVHYTFYFHFDICLFWLTFNKLLLVFSFPRKSLRHSNMRNLYLLKGTVHSCPTIFRCPMFSVISLCVCVCVCVCVLCVQQYRFPWQDFCK
jgi:hypothetical protein